MSLSPISILSIGMATRGAARWVLRSDSTRSRRRLNAGDWARLGAGRALLFVHGTFSSCDAFHDLPPAVMEELSARYGGRLFAFDHPTLSDDPAANAEYLLAQLPAGTSLTVDIVCHSRGGLVAREIAPETPASRAGLRPGDDHDTDTSATGVVDRRAGGAQVVAEVPFRGQRVTGVAGLDQLQQSFPHLGPSHRHPVHVGQWSV